MPFGYSDFPSLGNYCVTDRIYFIHPKKNIMFHMYDDRRLDIFTVRAGRI
ncbi:DUF3885 domain-containing protein [Paenibacillus plantarum]